MNTQENSFSITGQIVDIINRDIFPGEIQVINGVISQIIKIKTAEERYILPGFIDSHIHIESSMLTPSEFARLAVVHGTVGAICDPHEIANVLGVPGVEFMLKNAESVPFKFLFGAPSCVPATPFETAGATFGSEEIETLLDKDGIGFLAEMMNVPGVLNQDEAVLQKLKIAKSKGMPIDGHAPGLEGQNAKDYFGSGITADHESFTLNEGKGKLELGVTLQIREGSAAKNFDTLIPLLKEYPERIMFCSDDKHPDDLVRGHINLFVKRALEQGHDLFNVLRSASLIPAKHYSLPIGTLQIGDSADFIVVDDLKDIDVLATYINGIKVAEEGKTLIKTKKISTPNNFKCAQVNPRDLAIKVKTSQLRVIQIIDGELITKELHIDAKERDGLVVADLDNDILKLVVVNRYNQSSPAITFVKGIGLKKGAIASSVAHDSHNIICAGVSDQEICDAINSIIKTRGGVSLSDGEKVDLLPLPIAGLMSEKDGYLVAEKYENLDRKSKKLGSSLFSPFMTLSFLALLVIPELKLSDKGLFDGKKMGFVDIWVE